MEKNPLEIIQDVNQQKELYSANFRLTRVSLYAAIIGITAGFVAYLLYHLIGFFTNLVFFHRISFLFTSPRLNQLGPWEIIVPIIGGLIVGMMAKYGSEKIKGHGIPEAMEAILTHQSKIEPKVAILKPLSAAIAIGTGGPFGAEGPIIQTGGALGSVLGQIVHTTVAERKVLLACGAAAGMAATFNTPIAGVILAIELLLFEFKSRSFIPLVIATTLATSIHFELLGKGSMFQAGALNFGIPEGLPYFVLLGILCGLAATGFTKLLYWVEDQFEHLPFDDMWWPAVGGIALGIIGFFVPRVLGVGYDTISDILSNHLALSLLCLILVFKTIALVVSIGSGTSGGLLAPMFMSSAALGAVFALCVNAIIPGAHLDPAAFALVSMGAVFGAAARASFTFIIFAFEITRNYNAVLPLMLVGVIADGVARHFLHNSVMTEKLARRGLRVHQEYEADVLMQMTVGEAMDKDIKPIPAEMSVSELALRLGKNEPDFIRHQALLIVDKDNKLLGIITKGDVLKALEINPEGNRTVLEAGSNLLIVTYPEESLYDAVTRMLRNDIGRLPVVSRQDSTKLLGYLGRSAVMTARLKQLKEEHVREPGWFHRLA